MSDKQGHVIVVTSGKGGVGKTTTSAAIGTALAMQGKRTCIVDFDVGLRNLDLILGCERRVVFDLIHLVKGERRVEQAVINASKVHPNLFMIAASQVRDKDALDREGVERVIDELKTKFDYIICDSPAGIEHGAKMAMYCADSAVVVTNPEVSSVSDSDRIVGYLESSVRKTEKEGIRIDKHLLITRYDPNRVETGQMMSMEHIQEILQLPIVGIIPESEDVLKSSNIGRPISLDERSRAGLAYHDVVKRLMGESIELRYVSPERRPGFLKRLLKGVTND